MKQQTYFTAGAVSMIGGVILYEVLGRSTAGIWLFGLGLLGLFVLIIVGLLRKSE